MIQKTNPQIKQFIQKGGQGEKASMEGYVIYMAVMEMPISSINLDAK